MRRDIPPPRCTYHELRRKDVSGTAGLDLVPVVTESRRPSHCLLQQSLQLACADVAVSTRQSALACCRRNSCSSNTGRVIVAHVDHRRSSSLNTFTTSFFRDEKRKHLTMSKSGPFFLELGVADRRWTMTMTIITRSVSFLYTKR